MTPKFYFSLWIIAALAAVVVSLAGAMTMMSLVVFGFLAFGLTFVGMMCVLPGMVAHQHELEHTIEPMVVNQPKQSARPATARGCATLKSA